MLSALVFSIISSYTGVSSFIKLRVCFLILLLISGVDRRASCRNWPALKFILECRDTVGGVSWGDLRGFEVVRNFLAVVRVVDIICVIDWSVWNNIVFSISGGQSVSSCVGLVMFISRAIVSCCSRLGLLFIFAVMCLIFSVSVV